MPRVGDVFQLLSGTLAVPNTTIQSAPYNAQQNDWVTEANSPRPISAGGTGGTTAENARTELGAIGVGDLADADTKAAVVDTDSVVIIDSQDANTNKRWLVSDINAYMRTISPPTAQARNRIVNGAMQINQEWGTTPQTVDGQYPIDQWKINTAGLTGVIRCGQRTSEINSPYALHVETITAQPTVTSGYWFLSQTIEGTRTGDFDWGRPEGKPVVLRLRVKVNTEGTYGFFIRNNPATHTYVGTFTISDADPSEVGRVVEKVIAIPAPPTGTWAISTAAGITVGFTMAAAAANLAATAGWSASSTTYGVTGQMNVIGTLTTEVSFSAVGLYLDPDGTGAPPKWEIPDQAEELRACQRYWQALTSQAILANRYGLASMALADAGHFPFLVQMRTDPSVSVVGAGTFTNCSAFSLVADAINAQARVTVTATAAYRVIGYSIAANARY